MSEAIWYTGDALEVLKTLPDASVDLVITSPPFLALRSYLPADDPNKHLEMGGEATPGEFVDALMRVVEECRRVLAPHGSLGLELGDTYAGNGGGTGDRYRGYSGGRHGNNTQDPAGEMYQYERQSSGWPLNKSLSLIPETVRFTMVYGRNPHTRRETQQWRLRNVVRWCRPNPPVGALGDKYRPATTELMVFAKNAKRYFDLDAVRTEHKTDPTKPGGSATAAGIPRPGQGPLSNPAGAPPLDYWEIPTQPYRGAHYATWPTRLLEIPIKSMVPKRVCRVCGKPSERITETQRLINSQPADDAPLYRASRGAVSTGFTEEEMRPKDGGMTFGRSVTTVGWTDCNHNNWRNGTVLDPFAGTGTTLTTATGHGHNAIGIDLDPRNQQLAEQRIGMFLTHATLPETR